MKVSEDALRLIGGLLDPVIALEPRDCAWGRMPGTEMVTDRPGEQV